MKHAISLSIFIGLAIFIWWSITSDKSEQSPQVKSKQYAEIFMNEFEMIAMNEFGKPGYILNGTYLERYAGSDDTEVQQPVIQLLQDNNQWEIIAEQAIVNHKTETIQLKKNVVMQQQNKQPAVTIRTQYLLVHTKSQIAETHEKVDLTQGNSRLQSKGMVFNNITSKLDFSSDVNGHYLAYD